MKIFCDEKTLETKVTSDDGRWSSWIKPEPPNGGWGGFSYDQPWTGKWRGWSYGPNVNVGRGTCYANWQNAKEGAISFVRGNEEFDKRNRHACKKCGVMCYGRSLGVYEWLCRYCQIDVTYKKNL